MLPFYATERLHIACQGPIRKHAKLYLLALFSFSTFYLLWSANLLPLSLSRTYLHRDNKPDDKPDDKPLPPLYEEWYGREHDLPQHNISLPYPEGAYGEYLYASNHVWGLGFNNALQEQLFLSHLAYITNRAHVFDVYTWNVDSNPYTDVGGRLIPSRIPLSAFIAGPTAGGAFDAHDFAPRAVSKEYFQKVCPEPTLIKSNEVNDELGPRADAKIMMQAWSEKLRSMPVRCVEIGQSGQAFDYMVMGDGSRMVPFLEDFIRSPVIRRFAWSSLVESAVANNAHLLISNPPSRIMGSKLEYDITDSLAPIPGLISIHVRRGDFEMHCQNLAGWGSEYQGWLHSPLIIDRFDKPAGAGSGTPSQQVLDYYLQHCWPMIDQIVSKVEEVRATDQGKGLARLHVMTNGPVDWVKELKDSLQRSGRWDKITTSNELEMTSEQQYIGQAVDMAIAMRSQVFIGNGFSSMTSNIILLRLSKSFDVLTNRLW